MTGPGGRIRVLVADDQAIVRDGLVTVLGLLDDVEVIGQAEDGEQAAALAEALVPDVVLMDLRMPRLNGAEATARIVAKHPHIAVLVLTTYADDDSIASALAAGARGYLTKAAGRVELASALRAVATGQTTLAPEVSARVLRGLRPQAAAGDEPADASPAALQQRFALTPREAEVLSLVAQGRSNPDIASSLFVGVATVKTHINTLFSKLGVETRAQAIARVFGVESAP